MTGHAVDERGDRAGGVAIGLVLVALGGVLLLGAFDVIDAGEVLRRGWPAIPIVAGLWWLVRGPRIGGGIALVAGAIWAASANDVVDVDVWNIFWPLVLVVIGLAVVTATVRRPEVGRHGTAQIAVFDDRDWTGAADDLSGTSLVTVFGDADLRLTAPPSDGSPVVLTAWTVFGDVDIEVPAGWRVQDRTTSVFGSVSTPREPGAPDAPLLVLAGLTLFGDSKVRTAPAPR